MFLTRYDRQALEKDEWQRKVVVALLLSGMPLQQAWDVAESMHNNSCDEGGELMYTPEEAVLEYSLTPE